ncbi:hypothetical protein BDM02DRAFT_3122072 [Thelephora ganbajun]|uniref:Uncharacterized protein n=1 Tax=Thelephora ganbajun TaxID=370292 RepID=A0ACB6Z418_THEGA|nr:hypothetical protein BDM02DRAFT_3122072 [Thelephora ganbajun]
MQRPRKSQDGLPAELIDEVLSYFHGPDLVALRCCSLICRSWRIRSQLILFKHVSLWNESRLQSWCATIPPSSTGISSFVRTLELGGRWIRPQVLEQHIIHFTSLRKVRTLDVHDVDLKPFNEITFPRYFGHLGSSVQSLRLVSCRSSTDTYLELLKHFTRLEELFVSDTSSTKDPGVVVELRGMSGVNGSVQVRVDLDKATMPLWLSRISWKVQEAHIVATTKIGKPFALDTLFASPAHNLQLLCIELTKPQAQPEKYTLKGCNDLQQIHFQAVTIKRPCDFIPLTLSTVDSPELKKVVLDIACGEVNCQRKFDVDVDLASWAPVDQALCALAEKLGSGNPGVEFEVAVRVKGPKEVVRAVSGSKMFSGLRKKGVVTVSQL